MGDFYDPEHPTETEKDDETEQEESQRPPDQQEEENEAKNEALLKAFGKNTFKGISSSRFLPKGTKAKVNLEEQGRQKVSFSFSFTKKTLQNRLLTSLVNDKQNESPSNLPPLSSPEQISKLKMDFVESTGGTMEVSPPKPKVELGKIHFKKHFLNITSKLPAPQPPPPPPPPTICAPTSPSPSPKSESIKSSPEVEVESSAVGSSLAKSPEREPTNTVSSKELLSPPSAAAAVTSKTGSTDIKECAIISVVESPSTPMVVEKTETVALKEYSHIGKEEKISASVQSVKSNPSPEKPKSRSSHSETMVVGSESDGESVRTSSSHRSHELKRTSSRERDLKRSSMSLKCEDSGKYSSSRSKSRKDQEHSSYSRSERESKYSSYAHSRSDRERRRSRSHSREELAACNVRQRDRIIHGVVCAGLMSPLIALLILAAWLVLSQREDDKSHQHPKLSDAKNKQNLQIIKRAVDAPLVADSKIAQGPVRSVDVPEPFPLPKFTPLMERHIYEKSDLAMYVEKKYIRTLEEINVMKSLEVFLGIKSSDAEPMEAENNKTTIAPGESILHDTHGEKKSQKRNVRFSNVVRVRPIRPDHLYRHARISKEHSERIFIYDYDLDSEESDLDSEESDLENQECCLFIRILRLIKDIFCCNLCCSEVEEN
ncbi:histone-lysine N-methyltransferase SETD2 [Rhinoderma darwinii]|uniref:histone-lysine N-methyltransferase SETD2 n=1 Tax=Rhinoderma darwinii TaxID=43563 RepID=UPI003F67BA78